MTTTVLNKILCEVENSIPDASWLGKKTVYDAKISEIKK